MGQGMAGEGLVKCLPASPRRAPCLDLTSGRGCSDRCRASAYLVGGLAAASDSRALWDGPEGAERWLLAINAVAAEQRTRCHVMPGSPPRCRRALRPDGAARAPGAPGAGCEHRRGSPGEALPSSEYDCCAADLGASGADFQGRRQRTGWEKHLCPHGGEQTRRASYSLTIPRFILRHYMRAN